MVSLMHQLDRPCDAQVSDYTLFLGMSVRVFPEKISIWIGELSKADHPPQHRRASFNPLRFRMEQKDRGSLNSFIAWLLSWDIDLLLPSELLLLRPSGTNWNLYHQLSGLQIIPLAFLDLQLVDLSLHNHVRQFLIITHIYISMLNYMYLCT